jgi:hypothetical protein
VVDLYSSLWLSSGQSSSPSSSLSALDLVETDKGFWSLSLLSLSQWIVAVVVDRFREPLDGMLTEMMGHTSLPIYESDKACRSNGIRPEDPAILSPTAQVEARFQETLSL